MENLLGTLWTKHRTATIAAAVGVVAAVGVGGVLLLGGGGGSKETTTATSTPAAPAAPQGPRLTAWPTYGLDPARTRYLPTKEVKPPFKVAWRYDARHLMEYSPVVVDETLYGIDNNGEAFALNTRNGKPHSTCHLLALSLTKAPVLRRRRGSRAGRPRPARPRRWRRRRA